MNLNIEGPYMTWQRVDQTLAARACPDFEPVGEGGRVTWSYENAFALSRVGIEVVTPMPLEYDYPIRADRYPREHQIQGADFLAANHRAYLFMGAGTGKTLTAAWAFDYLLRKGIISRVLVITTLSTIYSAWGNDLDENLPHLRYKILTANSAKTRKRLFKSQAPVHIINHDGGSLFWKDLQFNDYDLIVLDESTAIKNVKTRRHIGMTSLKHACHNPRVWQMTATPTAQSPMDAYGQIVFASNVNHEGARVPPATIIGPTFMSEAQWKEATMQRLFGGGEESRWVPKKDANKVIFNYMRPVFSRRTRDVVKDLPPEIILPTRDCTPTAAQKKAWKALRSEGAYEQDGIKATITAPIATLSKVLQVSSGFLYGDTEGYDDTALEDTSGIGERPVMRLGNKGKNEELVKLIQEAEGKTVVYAPFTAAVVEVDNFLKSQGFKTIRVHGSLSPKEVHNRVNRRFQNENDPSQVLVAQPEKISHGITATAASLIVWYGPIMRGEVYQQANMRIGRIGQKRVQYIAHLACSDTERERYKQLRANHNRQQDFMALYESFQRGVT